MSRLSAQHSNAPIELLTMPDLGISSDRQQHDLHPRNGFVQLPISAEVTAAERQDHDSSACKIPAARDILLQYPDRLSYMDFERAVGQVLGSSLRSSLAPPRFAMSDMVAIHQESMAALEVSSEWKAMAPHIRRLINADQQVPAESVQLVPRMLNGQPGVVYAVRWA